MRFVPFLSLVLSASVSLAQTTTSSTARCGDGEERCRAKLIKTLDQLATCQEKRADQPTALGPRGTQEQPIVVEYKTPTYVWVLLGLSLAASVGLGIYAVTSIDSGLERALR